MMVRIAKSRFHRGEALEVVSDLVFEGHADAAVELNALLADEPARLADLHRGRGYRPGPLGGIGIVHAHGGEVRHAARLLQLHEEIDRAVLQRLEAADRHAELLARLEIIER